MSRLCIPTGMIALLSACAIGPRATPDEAAIAAKPLICRGADQCAAMWKRAQVWIATSGHYRLQLVSDAVINTYGPVYPETWYAYQATRIPAGDGAEEIQLTGSCANRFGCNGDLVAKVAQFKRFVAEALPEQK